MGARARDRSGARGRLLSATAAFVSFTTLSPSLVAAGDDAGARPPQAEQQALGRQHFRNGVKLFQDGNYSGALAEFEAAYRLKPSAASLQNIALSLKALFRYSEAAETLNRLLARHGSELTQAERTTIREAIDELSSLVGTIVLRVQPTNARVSVDGKPLDANQRARPIPLDVGEHTIVAEAPGFARATRTERVVAGQQQIPVVISLEPVMGFLTVSADDPDAAIAVDGRALAYHHWQGPVSPGRHLVQVYKPGHLGFERIAEVSVGQTLHIEAPLGPRVADDSADVKASAGASPPPPPAPGASVQPEQRGFYGLVALSGLGVQDEPDFLGEERFQASGGSFGVRAGYRIWAPVGVELLLEGGRLEAKGQCCVAGVERDVEIDSFRVGPNLRVMSSGQSWRFTSTAGVGAVQHTFRLLPTDEGGSARKAKGVDPYFLLELGAQLNLGHVLLELCAVAFIDGTTNIRYSDASGPGFNGLRMLGLGLRAGFSEWRPVASEPFQARQ